jgi:hypothetical protein
VAREWGAGRSSGAGPCIASRPDPAAGINGDTVRAPAADPGRCQARAARHLAGVPGRRLMPAAQPARSAGTPPGDADLDAAAAHPGQGGGRGPALPAGQQPGEAPWLPGTGGHAARRPGERQGLRRPGSTTGTDPRRGGTAPSPLPKTAHSKPADRAGKTGHSLAPPPAQPPPGCSLMPMSGSCTGVCYALACILLLRIVIVNLARPRSYRSTESGGTTELGPRQST